MTAGELCLIAPAPVVSGDSEKNITAALDYRNPAVRAGIWALKFRGDKKAATILAEVLWETLLADEEDGALFEGGKKPILTFIPLSKSRRAERGFNQCELLIDCLPPESRSFFEIRKDLLLKVRETEPQTKLKRRERQKNLHGAFEVVEPKEVRNRRLIIVDDVTTTGATFAEARRALLAAGAKEVRCVALAH